MKKGVLLHDGGLPVSYRRSGESSYKSICEQRPGTSEGASSVGTWQKSVPHRTAVARDLS